jgi:outer membrane lipoprotein SlyB
MLRIALPVALLAASALVGCAPSRMAATPAPKVVAQTHSLVPGTGVIQAAVPRPAPISPATAGAGASSGRGAATAAKTDSNYMRLTVRMDNGRSQVVDVPTADFQRDFRVGSRVELTSDGFIRKQS